MISGPRLVRRRLIASLVGAAAAIAMGQPAGTRRLGVLSFHSPRMFLEEHERLERFLEALAGEGFVVGRNLQVEERYASYKDEMLPELARQLATARVDVILTEGTGPTRAAREASTVIPIVTNVADPVASGFARELLRPGGNVTGVSQARDEMAIKQVELIRELFPGIAVLGAIHDDVLSGGQEIALRLTTAAARRSSIGVESVTLAADTDADRVFRNFRRRNVRAVLNLWGPNPAVHEAARRHRVAIVANSVEDVEAGAIFCAEPDASQDLARMAAMVAKIFRGEKPATIPFERPTRFHLTVNAKAAAALGIALPPSIRLRADRVIE